MYTVDVCLLRRPASVDQGVAPGHLGEGAVFHATGDGTVPSIRHDDVVSAFVSAMPVLLPELLQFHDGDVRIDVTEIDGTTVSGDTVSMHAGDRTVVAVERVGRRRVGAPGPSVDPHPIAKQRDVGSSIREPPVVVAVIRIARIHLIIAGRLKP
jgi:hypothetical protein